MPSTKERVGGGHYVPHSDSCALDELATIRNQEYKRLDYGENFLFNLMCLKRLLFSKMKQNGQTHIMKFIISNWANIDKEFFDLASSCNVRVSALGPAVRKTKDFSIQYW